MLAAAWFTLRGYEVLWPLEPCRYDLGVSAGDTVHRVQVKTTTHRSGGSKAVSLSSSRRPGRVVYGADEIDFFFVIDEDLDAYVIPIGAVAGYQLIHLRRYEAYLAAKNGQWLTPVSATAPTT
jgi:hypothetical protein